MPRVFMFDAFGTVFDVHDIVVRTAASHGVADPNGLSRLIRAKQLEYSWNYSLMGRGGPPVDFWTLTIQAIDFALASLGHSSPGLKADLKTHYLLMQPFRDVEAALNDLKQNGQATAVFTNGPSGMITGIVQATGLAPLIDFIISVEGTNRFKPDPAVYQHAHAAVGSPPPADVVFVSSNRWDIAGAANYGFTPIWCNRTAQPPEYPGLDPIVVVQDLSGIGGV